MTTTWTSRSTWTPCSGGTLSSSEEPDGVEAKEVSSKFTIDIVSSCAYGLNGNSFTDPQAEFREMGKNIIPNTWWGNLKITIFFMAPAVAKFFRFRFFNEKVTNFFLGVVKEVTVHREKNKIGRHDFLQQMINLKTKSAPVEGDNIGSRSQEIFTDIDVAAQCLTFFTDGFETTATALGFALFEVAVNNKVQSRLRTEINVALEKHGGLLNYEMLQECPYLDMVINETLRIHSPVAFLTRLCTLPYDLEKPGGGVYRVEVGTNVTIPVRGLHMDPEYFPNPEIFDPERFTEEEKAARHPYTFLPFGGGPRLCLGSRFGLTQVKAGIVTILSKFDLRLCKRTVIPLVKDPTSILPTVKDGVWIQFKKLTTK